MPSRVASEAQCAADRIDDLGRGIAFPSLLEAGVVVSAYAREDGDFLSP
jgi:hypothetical protein